MNLVILHYLLKEISKLFNFVFKNTEFRVLRIFFIKILIEKNFNVDNLLIYRKRYSKILENFNTFQLPFSCLNASSVY